MKLLAGIAAGLLAIAAPAGSAAMTSPTTSGTSVSYVTMFSDPGEWVGSGQQRFFSTTEGDSVTIGGTPASFSVGVSGGAFGDSFTLAIAAAPGQALHPGLYTNAQRTSFRTAGHPGIDISGDGRGCNTVGGRFDVKSIGTNGAGQINELWMTYEEHCEGGTSALFGEIRINAPSEAPLQQVPTAVWFPDTTVGTGSQTIPITFFATGASPVTVSSADVTGPSAGHFLVKEDDCTGVELQPGDGCQVWLRFVPLGKGPRTASLVVRTDTALARRVQLDGFGIGGHTELVMNSDPGDYIGQGLSYDYTVSDASINTSGGHTELAASVNGNNGDWWSLDFVAPSGDILSPGTTYDAVRAPFQNGGAGMDISGNGRGCNTLTGTFTVNSISVALDGTLKYASVSFDQHCEGADAALDGTIDWRIPTGDTTSPAAVTGLTAIRVNSGTATKVSWTNPTNADWSRTVVRGLIAATPPGSPNGSIFVYNGRGTSVTVPVPHTLPVSVAVYAIDTSGNVSAVRTVTIAPG